MKLIVREDYNECSRYLADRFEEVIRRKPDAFLGLATGSSPEGMYRYLCEDHRKGLIDLSTVSTINLDEYAGLSREHDQSFGYCQKPDRSGHDGCGTVHGHRVREHRRILPVYGDAVHVRGDKAV